MASAVKTRKMASYNKRTGSTSQPNATKSPPKITRYTLNLGNVTNTGGEHNKHRQEAMPTPTRVQNNSKKTRGHEEKVRDTHSNGGSDYESDELSPAPEIEIEQNENDIAFASLGELEKVFDGNIDPREISLSTDNIPIMLLFFLTRLEKLETKQITLETENSSLKGSLDFAYEKIDDLEKRDKEQAEMIQLAHLKIEEIKSDNTRIKVDAEKNKERNIKAEAYSRRQNLRFEGIPSNKTETNTQCRNRVYDILRRNLGIEDAEERIIIEKCHRDKKYPKQEPASILVRFLSLRDRQEIWEKRDNVNKNRANKIFINEDFPQEVERKRAFLRPYLKAAYASNRRAVMNGDTLVIESERYTVDTLHLLPDELKPEKVVVQTKNNVTTFFRSDAYLSNFHPSHFEIDKTHYCCVEQYYMAKKAEKFNDKTNKEKIMTSTNPREINYFGKQIKNIDQNIWRESAEAIMYEGVKAKFAQNDNLKSLLLETGNATLAEASPYDKFWGIGISMTDEKKYTESNWTGTNKLGRILMKCREELSTE